MRVSLSLDNKEYKTKPSKGEISKISSRVASTPQELSIQEIAERVGNSGCTFCPATFDRGERRSDNFKEMQLFALDFDTGISFEEICGRAERYELPIAFAYHTFSSTKELPKFRIIFINDLAIEERCVAEITLAFLREIFSEADQCCKDVARMFFGGCGIIGQVREETFNIVSVAISFQRYVFENDFKNYTRRISGFAKRYRISCTKYCLDIFCIDDKSKNEDFSEVDLYIYRSDVKNSSKIAKYQIVKRHQFKMQKELAVSVPVRIELGEIGNRCLLYHEFAKGVHVHHNEIFLLMTNMLHIAGGQKIFLKLIEEHGYDIQKWRFYKKYCKDREYKPQSCTSVCPYSNDCNHKTNMVLTVAQGQKIKKINADEKYFSPRDAFEHIYTCLQDAVNELRQGIYLIKAQTAVGKTESYCNLLSKKCEHRFLIAVPTNILKHEVEKRLTHSGIDVLTTISLDEIALPNSIKEKVQYYYNVGLEQKVAELLRNFVKNFEEDEGMELVISQCREYLDLNSNLDRHQHLITTHARLATMNSAIISRYTVIIDEDILSTFFKNIKKVSLQSIERAWQADFIPVDLKYRIRQIMEQQDGVFTRFSGAVFPVKMSEEELEALETMDNINGIMQATSYVKLKGEVYYFYFKTLPEGKYIVMSATHETELYQKYFKNTYIYEFPYYKAKYQEQPIQYSAHSMSRKFIQDHIEELEPIFGYIKQHFSIITFNKYNEFFENPELHFGNTEGVDKLKGKDIAVIGTPHCDEMLYKLIGTHLGMEVNTDVLSVRRVEYHGYEFSIMTYKQQDLRNLQLYYISKELEQSIGRARLIRCPCKVYVFSNFPCDQAKIVQEDYLEDDFIFQ